MALKSVLPAWTALKLLIKMALQLQYLLKSGELLSQTSVYKD